LQAPHFPGISVQDVHVWRGERQVLRGISFTVAAGDCLHVSGPNGSGKTTLLRVLAGFITPEQGSISCGGRPIAADRDAYCAGMSYLAHSDALKPDLTAVENLAFEVGLRRSVATGEIDEVLGKLDLTASRDQPAAFLSAGQRRRLAMARVMLAATPLWLLDEPFTNLDSGGAGQLSAIISRHLEEGGALVMAAHQPPPLPKHALRPLNLAP
jgi:heme exporter protein A